MITSSMEDDEDSGSYPQNIPKMMKIVDPIHRISTRWSHGISGICIVILKEYFLWLDTVHISYMYTFCIYIIILF